MKQKSKLTLIILIFLSLFNQSVSTELITVEKQQGMSFTSWQAQELLSSDSDLALAEIHATGANWISLIVTQYQENIYSRAIAPTAKTPTDEALAHAISTAHDLGMKVMLKPHVDLSNDPAHWRADIGKTFSLSDWSEWFDSYRSMIQHYARFAQEYQVDQFSVGTELEQASPHAYEWRKVIANVRELYDGSLTYSANHSGEEFRLSWWDALDYIGIDAYYPLSVRGNPNRVELEFAWQQFMIALRGLYSTWHKPILFTEIGYRSQHGTTTRPYDWKLTGGLDLQEQADAYQAFFNQVYWQPWFAGSFFWAWDPAPFSTGSCDTAYTPFDKPAEDVLRAGYGALPRVPIQVDLHLQHFNTALIEDGQLKNGWVDGAWVNPNDASLPLSFSQSHGLQISASTNQYLSLRTDHFDTQLYDWLELELRASDVSGWLIRLVDTFGNPLRTLPLDNCRYRLNDSSLPLGIEAFYFQLDALQAEKSLIREVQLMYTGKEQSTLQLDSLHFRTKK